MANYDDFMHAAASIGAAFHLLLPPEQAREETERIATLAWEHLVATSTPEHVLAVAHSPQDFTGAFVASMMFAYDRAHAHQLLIERQPRLM